MAVRNHTPSGDSLTSTRPAAIPPWAGRDRRAGVRWRAGDRPAAVRGGPPWDRAATAVVVDRSVDGVRLRTPFAVPPAAVLVVRLLAGDGPGDWFPMFVRHCQPDADGWLVGCEFVGRRPG